MNHLLTPNIYHLKAKKGFTLIELLIVISIIGIIATLIFTNLNDARARARDLKRKTELRSLKQALRMYYNDYQQFPDNTTSHQIQGCGTNGTTTCNTEFCAGGSGCQTIYMKSLPQSFSYYACSSNNDYRLVTSLENASDPDIQTSQAKCPPSCGATYSPTDYVLCPD